MQKFLNGVATALVTPFTKENTIHYKTFAKLIEFQIQNGIDAIVLLGSTGEPCTLSAVEKADIIQFAVQYIAKRCKLIVGTGGNNTPQVIQDSMHAQALGADGLLVVTPYYNKCTQAGLIAYYNAIAAAVHIPIICYNVPARTGVNITPDTMQQLATIPHIVGIKEASGNMQQICETAKGIRGKCQLYSGDDILNLPILSLGAAGVISVASNILPREIKAVYTQIQQANLIEANRLQDRLLPIIDVLFAEVNPIPVKAALQMLGFDVGLPRPPLTYLESENLEKLQKILIALGKKVK